LNLDRQSVRDHLCVLDRIEDLTVRDILFVLARDYLDGSFIFFLTVCTGTAVVAWSIW
jgi:hypothetical protein